MDIVLKSGSYRSITLPFEWTNIPPFAVVTGQNGVGKTHLLELFARKNGIGVVLEGTEGRRMPDPLPLNADVHISENYAAQDVVFRRSQWLPVDSNASLDSIQQQALQIWNERHGTHPGRHWDHLWSLVTQKLGKQRDQITEAEFLDNLPPNFILLSDVQQANADIAGLFVSYLHYIDNQTTGSCSREKVIAELGPLPWDILDELLISAGLSYRVVKPTIPVVQRYKSQALTYQLMLADRDTGQQIQPSHLSSGERVMLQMVIWFFSFSQRRDNSLQSRSNRLLLLDEPDAHLHPALTKSFLDVIRSEFVEKHEVRVIMTTHSPSTVALTPVENLFVMKRDTPRITPVISKWHAVSQLTAGFVTIGTESKCVFVEGGSDRDFYTTLQTLLMSPKNGRPSLDPVRSMIFIDASKGHPGDGNGNPSGGKNNVKKWVAAIPSSQIAGIIDLDSGNDAPERVYVIDRYCYENYLLDPLFIYAVLLENNKAPPVSGVMLTMHDASNIAKIDASELQLILDTMLAQYEDLLPKTNSSRSTDLQLVAYHNGPTLKLKKWFIELNAKSLLEPLKKRFELPALGDRRQLNNSYQRLEIVPSELVTMLSNIQNS